MFRFGRKRKAERADDIGYKLVKYNTIESYLDKHYYESKDNCLEIGNIKNPDFTTVDIRSEADYVGDIRGEFTTDFPKSDDLSRIPLGRFKFVKIVNTVEHIQWIYQDALLNWVKAFIVDGGMVYIETPNLEFIAKIYITNLLRINKGIPVKFPANEYPGMLDNNGKTIEPENNLLRWVNFKIFSGCSPGDYHHCCYDTNMMATLLGNAGFEKISICSGDTLKVVAFNSGNADVSAMDTAIDMAMA